MKLKQTFTTAKQHNNNIKQKKGILGGEWNVWRERYYMIYLLSKDNWNKGL